MTKENEAKGNNNLWKRDEEREVERKRKMKGEERKREGKERR